MKKVIIIIAAFLLLACNGANAQILKPVKWSYASIKKSENEVWLYLKAKIDPGWHIYSTAQEDGGPVKTTFVFSKGQKIRLLDKIVEPKPLIKFEKVFGMDALYFEKEVVFIQKATVKGKVAVIKGKISFMACTNKECLPPDEVEFSITVK